MAGIAVNKITDPNFGNCMQLTNGLVDVRVTLDFGPRVIHCSCAGMENMFYQDVAKKPLGDQYAVYEDQVILYGGHRVWISPEIVPRCYHPDNVPVTATPVENGMTFTAAVEKHNLIQKALTIRLADDAPVVKVTNTISNVGLWDIELAPWAITMLDKGGQEVMPMPDRHTGYLFNRNISLWDYSEMNDSRIYWGKDFIVLSQDAEKASPFKLGYNNEAGWAAYFNKGQVFLKFFDPAMEGFFPDNGCCFESYTNGFMLEMETLGEFVQLGPDESVALEEEWELYTAEYTPTHDESQLSAVMEKFL